MKKIITQLLLTIITSSFIINTLFTAEIRINTEDVIRHVNRHNMLGVNIAMWHDADTFKDPKIIQLFKDAQIGVIRIPGGSMSDVYFWNGNGVREGNNTPGCIDKSKYKPGAGFDGVGIWDIDYSDWKPGFRGFEGFPKDPLDPKADMGTWHGNSDVKDHLDFIKTIGAEALITVNAGTGTPKLAAEWVKWANKKMGYNVKYWEIGNELAGSWEAGHVRPDGKEMDGHKYAEIFKKFAKAMKKVDPNIKIGGPCNGYDDKSWIKELLQDAGDYVDFITYHDYFTSGSSSVQEMFDTLSKVKQGVHSIKSLIKEIKPEKVDKIEIAITEYNSKLNEDIYTANLFNGLWVIAGLGEMLESDMNIATLWDSFTHKQNTGGGHGFILEKEKEPKADYWAMNIYHHYFANNILKTSVDDKRLKVYASKNKKGKIFIIVVNTSEKETVTAKINIDKTDIAAMGQYVRYSRLEYRWEPLKFFPTWNFGPTEIKAAVGNSFEFTFPPFSAIAFKLSPKSSINEKQLAVLAPDKTIVITGSHATIEVIAMDANGKPLKGANIKIKTKKSGIKIKNNKLTTGEDGKVKIDFLAPDKPEKSNIKLILQPDNITTEHTIRVVQPKLKIIVPDKIPINQNIKVDVLAYYGKGEGRPLENLNEPCKLLGMEQELKSKLDHGQAAFNIKATTVKNYKLKVVTDSGITSKEVLIKSYAEKNIEKLAIQFNKDSDLDMMRSKEKDRFKIDYNIRPNQGVFSMNLDGLKGWQQDYWNPEGFDKMEGFNWAKVIGMTVEIMVPETYDPGGSFANIVFVLQAFGSWWMPLKEISLHDAERGKWIKYTLMIEKPEWQESMKSFLKMIVVFNSEGEQKGNIYIDNIGFIEKVEK